ncbi:MAG: type VI secretion system baseplate subunit TssE [Desulfovibrio sp.]|jgi:type VI secretion system protein|nr:type VI secretion system baseplate subunit TssE [Desulfovibrio sp.]
MHDLTLLERIEALEKGEKTLDARDPARLQRSIVRHLTAMLNTHRGNVPIAPDYGLADLTDMGSSFTEESVDKLKENLERVIARFEPRITNVRVEYAPKPDMPMVAVFRLDAVVQTENGPAPLRLETILDAAGAVRLGEEDQTRGYL